MEGRQRLGSESQSIKEEDKLTGYVREAVPPRLHAGLGRGQNQRQPSWPQEKQGSSSLPWRRAGEASWPAMLIPSQAGHQEGVEWQWAIRED